MKKNNYLFLKNICDKLQKICTLSGASGVERKVADCISADLKKQGFVTQIDSLNNLLCFKDDDLAQSERMQNKDSTFNIMIAANTDEPSLIVTDITAKGCLKFEIIGDIPTDALLSKFVKSGNINGVISAKAIHLLTKDERKGYPKQNKLFIDIGAESLDEAKKCVMPGDCFTFAENYTFLSDDKIMSKSVTDRIGCLTAQYVLCEFYRKKKDIKSNINLFGILAAQKHVYARGLKTVLGCDYIKKNTVDFALIIDSIDEKTIKKLNKDNCYFVCEQDDMLNTNYVFVSIGVTEGVEISSKILSLNALKDKNVIRFSDLSLKNISAPYSAEEVKKSNPNIPCITLYTVCKNKNTSSEIISLNNIQNTVNKITEILKEVIRR